MTGKERARIQPEAESTLGFAHRCLGDLHGRNPASDLMRSRVHNRSRDRGGEPIRLNGGGHCPRSELRWPLFHFYGNGGYPTLQHLRERALEVQVDHDRHADGGADENRRVYPLMLNRGEKAWHEHAHCAENERVEQIERI
jgi:hypothetical protein